MQKLYWSDFKGWWSDFRGYWPIEPLLTSVDRTLETTTALQIKIARSAQSNVHDQWKAAKCKLKSYAVSE